MALLDCSKCLIHSTLLFALDQRQRRIGRRLLLMHGLIHRKRPIFHRKRPKYRHTLFGGNRFTRKKYKQITYESTRRDITQMQYNSSRELWSQACPSRATPELDCMNPAACVTQKKKNSATNIPFSVSQTRIPWSLDHHV